METLGNWMRVPECVSSSASFQSVAAMNVSSSAAYVSPQILRISCNREMTRLSKESIWLLDESVDIHTVDWNTCHANESPWLLQRAIRVWDAFVQLHPASIAHGAASDVADPIHICGRIENKAYCLANPGPLGDVVYTQLVLSSCRANGSTQRAILYLQTDASKPMLGLIPGSRVVVYNVARKQVKVA